jgi:hypothetical protein
MYNINAILKICTMSIVTGHESQKTREKYRWTYLSDANYNQFYGAEPIS